MTLPSTAHDARPVVTPPAPAVSLLGARLSFGERTLWSGLDLDVAPGEFVAVLGPNGSGKTSLVRVLLGLQALSGGEVRIAGREPRRGSPHIGYIPQQKALDPDLPLRGRDLVGLGLDGHRLGVGFRGRRARRARVDAALAAVGGTGYAHAPVGRLSGGEQQRLRVAGREPRRGSPHIGYIPQQKALDPELPLRGRDLVGLGLDGHRLGLGIRGRRERRARVGAALAAVGGSGYADAPVGRLSGGEQQRLRVAQALVGDPAVLLCDEPLLSLDLAHQATVTGLIDQRRRAAGTAVVFVTHEINPILPLVDRVLYLVEGRFRIGSTDEVMTSPVLSALYGTDVDVLQVRGRLVVVGADGADAAHCHGDD